MKPLLLLAYLMSLALLVASCGQSETTPAQKPTPPGGEPAPTATSSSTPAPQPTQPSPAATAVSSATATPEPAELRQEPVPASEAEALEALVDFVLRAKLSNLAILKLFSGGFQEPLLSANINVDSQAFQGLEDAWASLAPIRERTLAAIEVLEQQQVAASLDGGSSHLVSFGFLPGPFDALRSTAASFFGWVGGSGERSRARILAVTDTMSDADRTQLFAEWHSLHADQAPEIQDAESFFTGLRRGELDSVASRLHGQLLNTSAASVDAPQYAQLAQDQNTLLTQVAFEEGAEGLVRGAEFEVEASVAALNAQFPGIATGRDYTDEANEWVEYVRDVYQDLDQDVVDALGSQVKSQLTEPFGDTVDGTLGATSTVDLGEAISNIAGRPISADSLTEAPTADAGVARLGEDVRTAIAVSQDPTAGGAVLSVAVPDPDNPTITLPEGEYEISSYGAGNELASTDVIVVEAGWERTVGAPGTDVPSFVLRATEVRDELERRIESPETVAKWVRVKTEVNPDNLLTEVDKGATTGRYEGTINDWEISETSYSHHYKEVDNKNLQFDMTSNFGWDASPEEMDPGEEIRLSATGEWSGTYTGGGGIGDTFEYRTDGAGLIYEEDLEGRDRVNIYVWKTATDGLLDNGYGVTLVAPGSFTSTFVVKAFLWNQRGANVRWTYEIQETEIPVYVAPPVAGTYEGDILDIVDTPEGREIVEEDLREECKKFSSILIRYLCHRAPDVEEAVEGLTRERGAALEGLQPADCIDLPTQEEILGCDIAKAISAGDAEGCRILFEGDAERMCLLGVASTTGDPTVIEDLGDEALQSYVTTTGDLSVVDQIKDPLLHDQALTLGMWVAASRQLFGGSEDGRIPSASFCSRLRGSSQDPDGEFASNQNMCEQVVMTSRVLHAAGEVGGGDPQQECDAFVQRQEFEEPARQSCQALISDVNLIRSD